MTEQFISMDIPRPPEVPEDVHEAVVSQVHDAISRFHQRPLPDSGLANWLAQFDEDTFAAASEQESIDNLARRGLTPSLVKAVGEAAHAHFLNGLVRERKNRSLDLPSPQIVVRVPNSATAPYEGSGTFVSIRGDGFVTGDPSRLPAMPNNQSTIADPSTGWVGANFIQEHDDTVLSFDSASVDATIGCVVGQWVKTSQSPSFWADLSLSSAGLSVNGDIHWLGSGQATLDSWVILEAFTGSQSLVAPDLSSFQLPVQWQPPSIDGDFSFSPSPVGRVASSGRFSLPTSTWIWLMAGTAQELSASVSRASLIMAASCLWKVNHIYWW